MFLVKEMLKYSRRENRAEYWITKKEEKRSDLLGSPFRFASSFIPDNIGWHIANAANTTSIPQFATATITTNFTGGQNELSTA